jgi:uncharacterized membrane protein
MNKTRLEAFSDGVMAIIITIMVLELKIPHGTDWPAVRPLVPVFISYVLSFIIVGIYWGNHHHLLHAVQHVNSKMIWFNMHLLFWLSLLPFGTAWMGENNFSSITVAVYAAILFLCGLAYFFLLKVVEAAQPNNEALGFALRKQTRKGTFSSIGYLSAIPLAFVHPAISGGIFVLVAVSWWIPDRNIEKSVKEHG